MPVSAEISEYLLEEDKTADIEVPSAEGRLGYPQDIVDADSGTLRQLLESDGEGSTADAPTGGELADKEPAGSSSETASPDSSS
jgi:hypothetical protein